MMEKQGNLQFFVRKTKKDIFEMSEWFDADKIRIGFRKYDESKSAGEKITCAIDFYMSVPEFELLCHNLLSGQIVTQIAAGKTVPPMYKGNERNGEIVSRVLYFGKSRNGIFLNVTEGPGRKTDTGAVTPLYKVSEAPKRISIPLNYEEVKSFAIQGKRACNHYYMFWFGRNRKENHNDKC